MSRKMSRNKKRRHLRELVGVACVLAILAGGMYYLKNRQDQQNVGQSASAAGAEQGKGGETAGVQNASGQTKDTSRQEPAADSQGEQEEPAQTLSESAEQSSGEPSQQEKAPGNGEPDAGTEKAPEETTLAGTYVPISWAGVSGDRILICQTDAIEIRDLHNQVLKSYPGLGKIIQGAAAVYTNGSAAYYAAESESGDRSVWRLRLSDGGKEEVMALEDNWQLAGVNEDFLYYTVWNGDGMENMLKARSLSDGGEYEIGKNVDEVTVLPEHVVTMGLRFDISPVELKTCSPDGSNAVTIGAYVNACLVEEDRIYYLEYGSDYGYLPTNLKSCCLNGGESQVLAENLNALSFSLAGEHRIFYAASSEGADISQAGYLFYDYQTGETEKAADSGDYIQFLCSGGSRAYLEKENEIVVYDFQTGQFLEERQQLPEDSYVVEGFMADGRFFEVLQSSDHRVDVVLAEF